MVLVDFPAVSNYEGDRPGAPTIRTRGLVSVEFLDREIMDLAAWSWDDFLRANDDPALNRLAAVDGNLIWVHPAGALADRAEGFGDDITAYPAFIREHSVASLLEIPHLAEGLRGLEETRRVDLEKWMDTFGLDAVIFPTVADVGRADMDVNEASADLGWRNGVWVANGNLVPRHLGSQRSACRWADEREVRSGQDLSRDRSHWGLVGAADATICSAVSRMPAYTTSIPASAGDGDLLGTVRVIVEPWFGNEELGRPAFDRATNATTSASSSRRRPTAGPTPVGARYSPNTSRSAAATRPSCRRPS